MNWIEQGIEIKNKDKKRSWFSIIEKLRVRDVLPSDMTKDQAMCILKDTYYTQTPKKACKSNKNYDIINESKSSIEYTANGCLISNKVIKICEQEKNLTPLRIMELHDLDNSQWDVVSYKNNYWQTQKQGGEILNLYQSKLVVKPKDTSKLSLQDVKDVFNDLNREITNTSEYSDLHDIKPTNYNKMLEVNLSDIHLGKYVYNDKSKTVYGTSYTEETFKTIVSKILYRVHNEYYDYITLIVSNDFFNSDGHSKTTTDGTPQDTDLDWKQLFRLGCKLLISTIDSLKTISESRITPIKVIYTPSNHDMECGWYLIELLSAWYRNDSFVNIDDSFMYRKYQLYGNTLLGYSHGGDKIKLEKYPQLMALEAKTEWSNSVYREYHLAHLHSEHMIEEIGGTIVRRCSSPVLSDNYHCKNGYIGNEQKCQLFIYDKEEGLITIHNIRC